MKSHLFAALALAVALFAGARADAETVRTPETGDPAILLDLPDGWTSQREEHGTLILRPADKSATILLSVVEFDGSLDDLAQGTIAGGPNDPAPHNAGPAQVSGYSGSAFDVKITNSSGVLVSTHLIAVRLDAGHVAMIGLVTSADVPENLYTAARAVFDRVTITGRN